MVMKSNSLKLFGALTFLVVVLCVSIVITTYQASTPSALDQAEIGEYETDPYESEATERQYDSAQPWRDPGHISRYMHCTINLSEWFRLCNTSSWMQIIKNYLMSKAVSGGGHETD